MEKTKIKTPFGDWEATRSGTGPYIKRYSVEKHSIAVRLGRNDVFRANHSGAIYHGTSLSDAVEWADNYIAENFEVEKPVEERLKDAEAEIVTLKAKVAELENPAEVDPLEIGVRVEANPIKYAYADSGFKAITKREKIAGRWLYSRDGSSPWLPLEDLTVEDDGFKFKVGQKIRRVHDSYAATIFTRKKEGKESKYQLSYTNHVPGSIWWTDSELKTV